MRAKIIISICIVVTIFIAYEPLRHNGFVIYDDQNYITENPHITGGITQDSIIWAFTKSHAANWHPLTWLGHIIDYQIFGLNPLGYHLVSLLLHIANSLLVFWLFSRMTGAVWASTFIAAVFALHPLQVESVAWAAEQKTVLSGLLWSLTIAAYFRYTKSPGFGRYVPVFLVYCLCILTKPIVVTVPLTLLLLDYWPLGRVNFQQKESTVKLIIEKIPLFILSAFLSVMTLAAQKQGGAVATLENIPLNDRIGNMFISYMRYIGKLVWPSKLAVFYPPLPENLPKIIAITCALSFVIILVLCIYIIPRRKYITTGWLWYIGTLFPTIGLVQAGAQSMANRYMYIPMLGLLIIFVWTVKDFAAKRPRLSAVLAMAVLLPMILLTQAQVKYWQNGTTLFDYTLKVTENNPIAENCYGIALFDAGRGDEAVQRLSRLVNEFPLYSDARNNLSQFLLKQGKPDRAIECFNELIKQKQDSAQVYYNLAAALSMQKKYDDAVNNLAKSLKLEPEYPGVQRQMGFALLASGKADQAVSHLNQALRTEPNNPDIYVNLGTAYTQLGQYRPAVQNWSRALEIQPDSSDVLNNLAWVLAVSGDSSIRNGGKAVELAERACELTKYNNAGFLDTLAVAYAAAGRFSDAITTAQRAINLAKTHGQDNMAGEIQTRLELYKANQAYIQK
ncbi:MAG: tetratricopeptide repeat protein [Phycisphaerae bacterium]